MLLPVLALALRIAPLRRVLRIIEAQSRFDRHGTDLARARRIVQLVEAAAAGWWPRPGCLTKALVLFALLLRRGLHAELVIGVARVPGGLEGHAWVRHGGEVLVGGDVSSVYAPLLLVADERGRTGGAATSELSR